MRRGGQRHGGRGGGGGGGGSSSLPLPSGALTAAALQDELVRRFQGAPTRAPRRRKAPPRRRPPPRPESPPQDELTLAQRLGLVERPPPRLSAAEWQAVYEASRARGDPLAMCPICRCDFGGDAQQQVLLSCSHVFHRACLTSYERFSGRSSRTCPMCRVAHYHKTAIGDSEHAYNAQCAVRVQAAFRGFLARRRVAKLREVTPPVDPRRRRAWHANKVERAADKLVHSVDHSERDVDSLMRQLDASLRRSRCTMQELDSSALERRLQRRLEERAAVTADLGRYGVQLSGLTTNDAAAGDEGGDSAQAVSAPAPVVVDEGAEERRLAELVQDELSLADGSALEAEAREALTSEAREALSVDPTDAHGVNWDAVVTTTLERGGVEDSECPICLQALQRKGKRPAADGELTADGPAKGGGIAWLSCTHIFHADCLSAFEDFGGGAKQGVKCPVCRCPYKRLHLPDE